MTTTETALIELHQVRAGYDEVEVLHGIDLSIPVGQVLAVLGPNGAGKSTLLRVLAGLHPPTSGDLVIGGNVMTGADPTALALRGLCLIPEGRGVFPNLTVAENLWLLTNRGATRRDVEQAAFHAFPVLRERRNQLAGSMSGGEQQMLAMARAIATDPALLLVDELSMGLAPRVVSQLFESVARIGESGVTIVVVEQFVQTVLGVADRAVAVVGGRIVLDGSPTEIAPELHSAYFAGNPDQEDDR
ncbi:MAG: ABC transporter ATP-binding protein [Acidimicrobiales bacterium]|nr:ABC transporter ATP-binding protein [Acidimicrobiales bacterium]